ncbi:hypothetical protein [Sneathiella glossodoripedis]|uniref:hypothetical protein n=1 Tax=Sneathiella glossodoripedis TaxID=418853 RepID=UPI00047172B6|nr:hypothetical protein [Sneathiella glossodoripedis]
MNNNFSIPPAFTALICQVSGFLTLFLGLPILQAEFDFAIGLDEKLLLQGAVAAGISFVLRQSYWWGPIHLIFPISIYYGLLLDIPIWVYPVLLILILAVFWNVVFNRVPLYLSNRTTAQKLATLIPNNKNAKFVDLGSGLANTLRDISTLRPDCHLYGYETAPVPFLISKLLNIFYRKRNVHIEMKNIWNVPLDGFDVVYCFLSPVPMPRLYEKARSEMKPGSLFISNSFTVPDVKPNRTITLKDGRKTKLFIWKM